MSAFVVEDETINRVITFLSIDRELDYLRRQIKDETGCDLRTPEGCAELGTAMFDLNCNAVNQRYEPDAAAQFRELDYEYRLVPFSRAMQVYKSLGCWLYQCSEGDVPETSLLYSAMQRVKADLADHIISRLPEYDSCNWG